MRAARAVLDTPPFEVTEQGWGEFEINLQIFFQDMKDSAKLETPYADFQSAGYLLGNAYRSGQTTPPERLPQVKAFRGVQAEVELVRAAAKKQDAAAAGAHFAAARAALVTYLELVELPALGSSAYKGL